MKILNIGFPGRVVLAGYIMLGDGDSNVIKKIEIKKKQKKNEIVENYGLFFFKYSISFFYSVHVFFFLSFFAPSPKI